MDLVRLLTSHGGDLNATESTGATPRDLAQQCDFYECADLIDELKGTLTVRKVVNVALFTDICLSVCLCYTEIQAKQAEDMLRKNRIQCKRGERREGGEMKKG